MRNLNFCDAIALIFIGLAILTVRMFDKLADAVYPFVMLLITAAVWFVAGVVYRKNDEDI